MIKRKIIAQLLSWKNSEEKLPIILRGARQVGKTTVIRELSAYFDTYVELNLERRSDAALFELDDVQTIFQASLLLKGVTLKKGKTLLFIDEIQEVPGAIALLRYFHEDIPDLFVIAAGSLLEFALDEVRSFPVGRVAFKYLHPIDFQEYLAARDFQPLLDAFHQVPVPPYAHQRLLEEFHTYITVGGMPHVLASFLKGDPIANLAKYYNRLWQSYSADIEKYGKNESQRNVLRHILLTAPTEKDRIAFEGFGNSAYRSREVGEAMRALDLSRVIRVLYPSTSLALPIITDFKKRPRLQFIDTGLLCQILNLQGTIIGIADLSDFERGRIIQHGVYQELIAQFEDIEFKPTFWVRESSSANAELDIVLSYKGMLIPVEIKSGKQGRLRSMHQFIERTQAPFAIRFYAGDFSIESAVTPSGVPYQLMNIPYYLVTKLGDYIDYFFKQTQ